MPELPALRLEVLVQPRASRERLLGWQGERLKVALCAAPVDGEANAALLSFLSKTLGLKASQLSLASGPRSRRKTLLVSGLDAQALSAQLPPRTHA